MRTIGGIDYVSIADMAELWGVEHVYTIRNRIYAELRKGNRFPEPDIQKQSRGRVDGLLGGATPALWRHDRLPELTAWWDRYSGAARRHNQDAEAVPATVPATAPTEPTVIFTNANITLTVAEYFPKLRDSHVLAIVRRGESHKLEHYFITREDAEFILSLFE